MLFSKLACVGLYKPEGIRKPVGNNYLRGLSAFCGQNEPVGIFFLLISFHPVSVKFEYHHC